MKKLRVILGVVIICMSLSDVSWAFISFQSETSKNSFSLPIFKGNSSAEFPLIRPSEGFLPELPIIKPSDEQPPITTLDLRPEWKLPEEWKSPDEWKLPDLLPKTEIPQEPKLSDKELEILEQNLSQEDLERLRNALTMGDEQAKVKRISELIDKYENPEVRKILFKYVNFYAAYAATSKAKEAAVKFLADKLQDEGFKEFRKDIIETLGKSKTDVGAEALFSALKKDEFKQYQSEIIKALIESGQESVEAIKKLGEILKDPELKSYQNEIIEGLVNIAIKGVSIVYPDYDDSGLLIYKFPIITVLPTAKTAVNVLGEVLKLADKELGKKIVESLVRLGQYQKSTDRYYYLDSLTSSTSRNSASFLYLPDYSPFDDLVLNILKDALTGSTDTEVKLFIISEMKQWALGERKGFFGSYMDTNIAKKIKGILKTVENVPQIGSAARSAIQEIEQKVKQVESGKEKGWIIDAFRRLADEIQNDVYVWQKNQRIDEILEKIRQYRNKYGFDRELEEIYWKLKEWRHRSP